MRRHARAIGPATVRAVEHQAVSGHQAAALDQRDGVAVAFVGRERGAGKQMPFEHALHHL